MGDESLALRPPVGGFDILNLPESSVRELNSQLKRLLICAAALCAFYDHELNQVVNAEGRGVRVGVI
jgi:hypothetical protein